MRYFMDFIRHHKRAMLIVFTVCIGIPFIFAYGPSSNAPNNAAGGLNDRLGSVGPMILRASQFRKSLNAAADRGAQGERATYKELMGDGTVERIMEQMVNGAYLQLRSDQRNFEIDDALAIEQLKKQFHNEEGVLNGAEWNRFVKNSQGQDWKAYYANAEANVAYQMFLKMVTAPAARVFDSDIEEELQGNYTKIKVAFVSLDLPAEATDAQIQEHFAANEETYRNPQLHTTEFVALSLLPAIPETATKARARAEAGENFAALVDEYSDFKDGKQGDMGWLAERENEPPTRAPIFALEPGQVTEHIVTTNSVMIYKVEEERTNEETQKREVKVRQMRFNVKLDDVTRAQRIAEMQGLLDELTPSEGEAEGEGEAEEKKALTAEDFAVAAAATESKPTVAQAGPFTVKDAEISGISQMDVSRYRQAVDAREEDVDVVLVEGMENVYVAHVLTSEEGAIPGLEEVRDRVEQDVIAQLKREDAYRDEQKAAGETLLAEEGTLNERAAKHPDWALMAKTSETFTQKDSMALFQSQCYVRPDQVYQALKDKDIGDVAGPVQDFMGKPLLFELLERTLPTEEDKANWEEERKQIRQQRVMMAQDGYLSDYLTVLREQMELQTPTEWDTAVLEDILDIEGAFESVGEQTE
jgi:parvulin-like peptidyl-prolyl isomerase